jgi:hypothetical protein
VLSFSNKTSFCFWVIFGVFGLASSDHPWQVSTLPSFSENE